MLTAKDDELDKLLGLGLGADDYVVKPYSPREVVARIKAVLRRANGLLSAPEVVRVGGLEVDLGAYLARCDGQEVALTVSELRLLAALAREPGRVQGRPELLAAAGDPERFADERTVDAHIKNLRRKLRGCGKGLERQEAWRRNLVADVAHDLRTPLSVMRSEIEAMQDGVATFDEAGLARLHAEVMRLAKLVNDLRTLSLAEGGGLVLQTQRTRIKPLLESTHASFAARAAEAGVALELHEVPDALEAVLDPDQVTRVLGNLLDNALRYAAGPIELGAAGGEEVRVWVRDHGPGLPEEAPQRLFERFYRGDASRTRGEADGSGLGLSIADAIVKAHGGRLEAINHPEGGALFTVHLPGGGTGTGET